MVHKTLIPIFILFASCGIHAQVKLPMDTTSKEVQYDVMICIDKPTANSVEESLETYLKTNFVQGTFKTMKWERDSVTYMFKGWRNATFGKKTGIKVKSWVRVSLSGKPDSLLLRLDEFATQDFESNEMPNPQQNKITDLYHKYIKKYAHHRDTPVIELYLDTFDAQIKSLQGDLINIITTNCQ